MKYYVSIADQEIDVAVDGDQVTIGTRTYTATLTTIAGTPVRQLLVDSRPMTFAMSPAGRGQWIMTAHGERLDVGVIDERTRHIRSLVGESGARPGAGAVRAPMPGLVVRVPATVGQEVAAGASLVVLEAMKMENELRAPAASIVRAVLVEPGQTVEKGQTLVELE